MTVAELIEALCDLPPHLEVMTTCGDEDNPVPVYGPSVGWVSESGLIWVDEKYEGARSVVSL